MYSAHSSTFHRALRSARALRLPLVIFALSACGDDSGTAPPGGSSGSLPTPGMEQTSQTSHGASGGATGGPGTTTGAGTSTSGSGGGLETTTTGTSVGAAGEGSSSTTGSQAGQTFDGGAPMEGVVDAAPAGADSTVAADATAEVPPHEDLGEGDGSDVVMIGDSWMTMYGGGVQGAVRRAGKDYRQYGQAGAVLSGISRQYERAKGQGEIATVIMTGGGNDIMFTGGCNTAAACEESVADLVRRLNELWTMMSNDGVRDVIYINYADDAGTGPESAKPTEAPPPAEICLGGPIRCHAVETTELVMGDIPDGIHPSGEAHDRIAAAVLALMEERGIRR